jgi:hypothetical protein
MEEEDGIMRPRLFDFKRVISRQKATAHWLQKGAEEEEFQEEQRRGSLG